METIRHRLWGNGTVVSKESTGNSTRITVRFDANGKEANFSIPESFETGVITAGGNINAEVTAAIKARELQRMKERAKSELKVVKGGGKRRTSKIITPVKRTGDTAKDFESYLKINGYSTITVHGTKSTVYSYLYAIDSILKAEGMSWSALEANITQTLRRYDIGGAKEDIGNYGNRTVINALRRFSEFVNF